MATLNSLGSLVDGVSSLMYDPRALIDGRISDPRSMILVEMISLSGITQDGRCVIMVKGKWEGIVNASSCILLVTRMRIRRKDDVLLHMVVRNIANASASL